MINFFKGFVIGIGKIIPGVSGAMLAIILGVYDKAIFYICDFRNNIKKSICYLMPIGVGIVVSIAIFSRIISYFLDSYYVITMLFFVGLIVGGVPSVMEKVKNSDYFVSVIGFVIFFVISIIGGTNEYVLRNNFVDGIMLFSSGIIEAISSIVPGISGTALLMVMGTYNIIIFSLGNMVNLKIMIIFVIGILVGTFLTIKVINYLFKCYNDKMYALILGFLMASIVLIVIQTFRGGASIYELVIGIVFMIIGIFISNVFKEK